LARVPLEGKICLTGIRAAVSGGAPFLEWAMETESGVIFPRPGEKPVTLDTTEVVSLDLDATEDLTPEQILNLNRTKSAEKLLWTPASFVIGAMQASQAKIGFLRNSQY
jgi:hypothetical protein